MSFKMKGHTLPGINQRMDKSSLPDGRAKSSAFQKDKPGSVASQDVANTEYLNEMKTYGKRPEASAETKDYYEGQTKKTSTKGKVKAFIKSYTGGGSYKEEKKKQRKKAYTKDKKRPSDLETLKYIKTQPRQSTYGIVR
jgi:hypothetical protein